MKSVSVLLRVVVVVACLIPVTAHAEHRMALLIGNADYPGEAALTSREGDLKAVAVVLQRYGFRTSIAVNLSKDGLYSAVEDFIARAPINGTAFIYFTGCVVPAKSQLGTETALLLGIDGKADGLPLSELMDWMFLRSATSRNLFVIDDCKVHRNHQQAEPPVEVPAPEQIPENTRLGMTSATSTVTVADEGRLSVFSSRFSTSASMDFDVLLNEACRWSKSTLPRKIVTDAASIAIAAQDAFPEAADVGDEWVAADGTVFCWCPADGADGGFWIGKYEVPQSKWPVAGYHGGIGVHRNDPVTRQSSNSIHARLVAITNSERKAGRLPEDWEYALPSPEQWEYAARAGTTGQRYFSDEDLAEHANFADRTLFDSAAGDYLYADKMRNDGAAQPAPVGSYKANPWGLHDVYGNVWEQTDTGVLCGGSWLSPSDYCRATVRKPPIKAPSDYVGFRLILRRVPQ